MSGAQGLPQRMTQFVDAKTGLVTDTWWRFLNTLYNRTGGAQATTSTDDLISYTIMDDTPQDTPPEAAAWLALAMADVAPADMPEWMAALLTDPVADVEPAFAFADDPPAAPENDPALVAMMVSDS